jgi:hypothetical protein
MKQDFSNASREDVNRTYLVPPEKGNNSIRNMEIKVKKI